MMDLHLLIASALLVALHLSSPFQDSLSCISVVEGLQQQQHLTDYDEFASSSSFGEPVFRLEPPSVINFASSQGATILCLASGSPRPTISWYSSSSSVSGDFSQIGGSDSLTQGQKLVGNVTNLRQILLNGSALRLLPFKESDFRQDIHSTEYRCVASNYLATIHSRSCLVQAASLQEETEELQVKVSDEFGTLNSLVVFRCRSSALAPEHLRLLEWFTSDGLLLRAGQTAGKGNRIAAFITGELHLANVELGDFRRSYGCRVKHAVSGKVGSSSGLAQLILLAPPPPSVPSSTAAAQLLRHQQQANSDEKQLDLSGGKRVQVLHTTSQLIAGETPRLPSRNQLESEGSQQQQQHRVTQSEVVLLPCAFRSGSGSSQVVADKTTSFRWLFVPSSGNGKATPLNVESPNYRVGPSYLALESPSVAQSGRYLFELNQETVCDIKVIIRRPLHLSVALGSTQQQQRDIFPFDSEEVGLSFSANAATSRGEPSAFSDENTSWFGRALDWLEPERQRRGTRGLKPRSAGGWSSSRQMLSDPTLDVGRIRVTGSALIPAPPIFEAGRPLRLECIASGQPVDGSIRWFVNGEPVNAHTAPEIELTDSSSSSSMGQPLVDSQHQVVTSRRGRVVGTLSVRSLQARSAGLMMFECFVQNSLGDRARASLALFLAEPSQLDSARSQCPLGANSSASEENSVDTPPPDFDSSAGVWPPARSASQVAFERANPLQSALLLENEPVKLECPSSWNRSGSWRLYSGFEWRKWIRTSDLPTVGSMEESKQMSGTFRAASNKFEQQKGGGARNFNQLFGGDSRFVINGSSLQIRSPSKRHDEALYVCLASSTQETSSSLPNLLAGDSTSPAAAAGVHQSSLAVGFAGNCLARLRALFSSTDNMRNSQSSPRGGDFPQQQQQQMSSISIRIVAKPKIEPFEFSRNLEEGMRAWAVCGIVSGQTPVDITWFKDGQLLLTDQETSIEQPSDQLSSTLTFHRINPAHSGIYTCVASNAFSSANHSSRLLVNVAPYFTDPPKSRQAILGSSVLINCRAGGQPSPQIRWRKLLLNGAALKGSSTAPGGGNSGTKMIQNSELLGDLQTVLDSQSQVAPSSSQQQQQHQFEFRIITSNSRVQILENGSLIIKDVELSDSARYACQAFNGIQPSLSEVIELSVLSPAQFEVNYETLSVKRDALVRFNCAPRGDQPMRIEWLKEGVPLTPSQPAGSTPDGLNLSSSPVPSKYSELIQFHSLAPSQPEQARPRHQHLLLRTPSSSGTELGSSSPTEASVTSATATNLTGSGILSSELLISYADRFDSGMFVCIARNAYGSDRLTYRLLVQEPPDTPTGVTCQSAQSSSLSLSWPAPFDGNLALSHYVLEYRRVPDASRALTAGTGGGSAASYAFEWLRLLVPAREQLELGGVSMAQANRAAASDHLQVLGASSGPGKQPLAQVVLRQLQARTSYQIRVAAVNAMGQGGFSTPVVFTTGEEPPISRANDLRTLPVSSSQLKVLWRGPSIADEQAPIRAYYVSHRRAPPSLLSSTQQIPNSVSSVNPAEQQHNSSGRLWIATQSVSATNASNSPASMSNGLPASYEILLNNLEKNSRYEIRVQPYNSAGVGPSSETSGQTLRFDRPGQPTLKLVAARLHSLELRWSLTREEETATPSSQTLPATPTAGSQQSVSDGQSELLLGFSLFYKCEYDDWQEIQLAPIYRYLLENLRCGNKYQLYLSAFNAAGRSEPSDVLSARTEGTVPLAPADRNAFLQANVSELVLDMARWKSGGCPITSYIIQFKRLHDTSWFLLSEGANAPFSSSDKIVVPDLVPATWYKLLVSALNEAGTTNAEYIFSTLDPFGKPIQPTQLSQRELELQQSLDPSYSTAAGARSLLRQLFEGVVGVNQPEAGLLLPAGCLLLLLITALASYLYYARPVQSNKSSQQQQHHHHHHTSSTSSSGVGFMMGGSGGTGRTSGSPSDPDEGKQLIHSAARSSAGQFVPGSVARILLCGEQGGAQLPLNEQQSDSIAQVTSSGLDSLLVGAGLHSFVGGSPATLRRRASNQQHGLRLLELANNQQQPEGSGVASYTTGAASSSLSTHSTNFDAQSSSQASSSGMNCPQVQQVQGQPEEQLTRVTLQAGNGCHPLTSMDEKNSRHCTYNCQLDQQHLCQQAAANNYLFASPINPGAGESIGESTAEECHLFQSAVTGNCDLYQAHAQARLQPSASFASATDLLQRRQQQELYLREQRDQEPIYQRLDTFNKQLSKHFKSGSLASQRAQTLKFGTHLPGNGVGNIEQFINAAATQQQQQQQEKQCNSMSLARGVHLTDINVDNYFNGGLYPGTPAPAQIQSNNNTYLDAPSFPQQSEQIFYQ